jgi:hypothetical protein
MKETFKELDQFVQFITERWLIHKRRLADDKPPWTKHPVLLRYRFTNVRREDDRVTKWIHTNWLWPNAFDKYLWFAMVVARLVNWPVSLQAVGYPVPWKPSRFTRTLNLRKEAGLKVFTSAYMIRAIEAKNGETKADYLAKYVLKPMWADRDTGMYMMGKGNLREFHEWLSQYYGMGSFLAAQVVADLKWATMRHAVDWWTFSAPGPGSVRGMSRVEHGHLGVRYDNSKWGQSMNRLRKQALPRLPKELRKLDAQNLQSCLCEYDKYQRALLNEGRPRQNFKPSKEEYQ